MKKIFGIMMSIAILVSSVTGFAYFPDPDNWTYINTAPGVELMGVVSTEDLSSVKVTTDFDIKHEYYNDMYLRVYYNAEAEKHNADVRKDYGITKYGVYDDETGITTFTIDLSSAFGELEGFKTFGFVIYYANTSGTKISDWTWRTVYVTDNSTNTSMKYNSDFNTADEFISSLADTALRENVTVDESDGTLKIDGYKGEIVVDTAETDNNDATVMALRYKLPETQDGSIRPVIAFTDSDRVYTNGTNGVSVLMHQASTGNINFTGAFKNLSGTTTTVSTGTDAWIDLFAIVNNGKLDYILWYQNKNAGVNQRTEQKNMFCKTGSNALDTHTTQLQANPAELLRYVIFNTSGSAMNIDYMYVGRIADAGIDNVSATPREIKVMLNGMMNTDGLENLVHITDGVGENVEIDSIEISNNVTKQEKEFSYNNVAMTEEFTTTDTLLTIKPQKYLSLNNPYYVTVDAQAKTGGNIEIGKVLESEFVCSYPEVEGDYTLLWAEFNEGSFDTVVKNETDTPQEYYSIVSEFEGNKLISQKAECLSVGAGESANKGKVSYNYDEAKRYEGNAVDKATLKSISPFEFETAKEEASQALSTVFNNATGVLSIAEQTENAGESVSALVVPADYDIADLTLQDINDGKVYITTMISDESKKISKDVCLNEYLGEGDYLLYYAGIELNPFSFSIIDKAVTESVLSTVNTSDSNGIYNAISQNAEALRIDTKLVLTGGSYIGDILEAKRPENGYEYEEFFDALNKALVAAAIHSGQVDTEGLLTEYGAAVNVDKAELTKLTDDEKSYIHTFMKSQDYLSIEIDEAFADGVLLSKLFGVERYSEMESIILDNTEAYGVDTAKYDKLSEKYKAKVWEIFYDDMSKINKLDDVSEVFDDAVKEAPKSGGAIKPVGGGSSSGGSGSSSGSSSQTISPTVHTGGSYGLVVVDDNAYTFHDLDKHWGKEAIMKLYEKNIVNGYDDGNFRPDGNVTRAEFVKMAVGAFNLTGEASSIAFDDVSKKDWYYEFVNAAVANEIVQGYGSKFNPSSQITRQDAAVILYRIISLEGLNMLKQGSFEDEAEISDYALEPVKSMAGAGIISGSDGKFMPENNSTRAEAVQMIYNVMNYLGI